jgi:outer membrane murein-binding lipoprotein Lpp
MSDPETEAALREMSRSIGGLESTVKSLVSTWQSQETNASQGRRDLHTKFDALSEKVTGLTAKVDTAIRDITLIKPSVQAFENAKEQAIGAQRLGKGIWAALLFLGGGSGAGLTWVIANWVTIGPKPPLH